MPPPWGKEKKLQTAQGVARLKAESVGAWKKAFQPCRLFLERDLVAALGKQRYPDPDLKEGWITMQKRDDKRQRIRIDFETQVTLKFANPEQTILPATMKNISMTGIFVETDQVIAPDTPCRIDVIITAPHSRLTIETEGLVSRQDTEGLGVKFKNDLEWFAFFSIFSYYGRHHEKAGAE